MGDEVDRVGLGYGKAREVPLAITKAVEDAKKNMFTIPKHGSTITHEVLGRFDAARVMLRPASEGTGVIAGGGVRAVLELGGIHNVLAKSLGTTNPINMAKATVAALKELRRPEDVAKIRGKRISEVLPFKPAAPAEADEVAEAPAAEAAPVVEAVEETPVVEESPVVEEAGPPRNPQPKSRSRRPRQLRPRTRLPKSTRSGSRSAARRTTPKWRRSRSRRSSPRSGSPSGIAVPCARSGSARSAAAPSTRSRRCSPACSAKSATS